MFGKLFETDEVRDAAMRQRTDALNLVAKRFKIPDVVQHILVAELQLRPHRGIARHASSDVDITYKVVSGNDTSYIRGLRKPFFISTAMEVGEGEFYQDKDTSRTHHEVHGDGIYAVALTEAGEFRAVYSHNRPIRLGTTAVVKSYADLLAAAKDHIQREKRG